jgi:hypothetical protein
MVISIGWRTFLFFGLFCLAAGIFSFLFVPETANKTLEQISAVFGDNLDLDEEKLRRQIERDVWTEVPS